MLLLLASLAALLAGPLIVRAFGASRALLMMLDAFVITSITGLVFLEVLPSALVGAGLWPVGAAVVGLWLPRGLEHVLEGRRTQGRDRLLLVIAALTGLAIHALLDGAALAPTAPAAHHGLDHGGAHVPGVSDWGLGISVILHRIPFGLVIWWTVRPRHGLLPAVGLLLFIAAATVGGFVLGGIGIRALPTTALLTFQALVAGALLHIVFEHPVDDPSGSQAPATWSHLPGGAGALLGAALVSAVILLHGEGSHGAHTTHADPAGAVVALALDIAPALLGGLLLVLLASRLPPSRRPLLEGLRGAAVGARAMPAPGAAPRACAFDVAASVLGLDALVASAALLGPRLTAVRVALAAAAALTLVLLARTRSPAPRPPLAAPRPADLRTAAARALDRGVPWVGFALLVAGLATAALPPGALAPLSLPRAFALALILAWPLYLCGLSLTPLALVLIAAGLAPGPALVLLVVAPLAHPLVRADLAPTRARLHRLAAAAVVTCGAVAFQLLSAPQPHAHIHEHAPELSVHLLTERPLAALALLLVVLLAAARLLQRGPRALLAELTPGGGPHRHHPHLGGPRAPAALLGGFDDAASPHHTHGPHDHRH